MAGFTKVTDSLAVSSFERDSYVPSPQHTHLPRFIQWMEARSTAPTCPVCKSVIDKERLIPLYGRGSADKTDPR